MLAIRLSRIGKKNSPFFRIVVMDKRKSAKGRALEVLGSVNPRKKDIILKNERIKYWLGVGAEASDRVYNILVSQKVIEGKKRPKKIRPKKKEEKEEESAPVAAAAEKVEAPQKNEEQKDKDPSTSPSADSGSAQDDKKGEMQKTEGKNKKIPASPAGRLKQVQDDNVETQPSSLPTGEAGAKAEDPRQNDSVGLASLEGTKTEEKPKKKPTEE